MKTISAKIQRPLLLLVSVLLLGSATQVAAAGDAGTLSDRTSVTRQGTLADRDRGTLSDATQDAYAALQVSGKRAGSTRASKPSTSALSADLIEDFWFFDADVELSFDRDDDGYYYGLDVWFDADTFYDAVEVYAVVYLSYEAGTWNEYASTDNFMLYGASAEDDYVIETDLISGYPTGSYDLLIELFDAYDGSFLASMGPGDSSKLGYLPLEDSKRDEPVVVVREVVVHSGGGATGILGLVFLGALAIFGRRRTQTRATQKTAQETG